MDPTRGKERNTNITKETNDYTSMKVPAQRTTKNKTSVGRITPRETFFESIKLQC